MGGFYGSIHLRTEDRQPVLDALGAAARRSKRRFLVAPPAGGWVAVYPSDSGMDEQVSRGIARRLGYDVVHLISYHEEVFLYYVYRGGRLVDRYSSRPDFERPVSPSVRRRLRGNPGAFRDLFADQDDFDAARQLLARPEDRGFSSELMAQFAERLRIPGAVMTSYEYMQEDGDTDDIEGWDDFVHIPDLSAERAQERRIAAEAEERKVRLVRDGVLLVERTNVRPRGAIGYPLACADRAGDGFWICADAGLGGGRVPVERYGPPWSAGPSATRLTLDANTFALVSSPSGRYLLAGHGSCEGWRLDLWDMKANRRIKTPQPASGADWYGFLPDETGWVGVSRDGIVITPIGRGRGPRTLEIKGGTHAAIHPSGKTLVLAGRGNRLLFVDLTTGRVMKSLLLGGLSEKSGLPALMRFVPGVAEAVGRWAASFDLDAIQGRAKRRLAESASLLADEVVLSGELLDSPPEEELVKAREALRAELIALHRNREDQEPGPPAINLVPDVSTPEGYDSLFAGDETPMDLAFASGGRWLCCATNTGVRVFSWRDLLTALNTTPPPRFSVDPAPYTEESRGMVMTLGDVFGLAYDPPADRLLFATMGGQVGFLDLANGRSGVLIEPAGRPPIMGLYLSRDRSAMCITCHPDRAGRRRDKERSYVQVWDYTALTDALARATSPEDAGSG